MRQSGWELCSLFTLSKNNAPRRYIWCLTLPFNGQIERNIDMILCQGSWDPINTLIHVRVTLLFDVSI